jgi:hypothetical protein
MSKDKRKKFSCDFETTTDIDDCRVWAYGYMEIGKRENFHIGNNLDEFMEWAKEVQADLYFHNLKFDGEFIVNWLLKNGYTFDKKGGANTFNVIISNMGQWYMIDICYGVTGTGKRKQKLHTVIYDSLKKLPFPVKKIAEDFKLEIKKGDIDYKAYRSPNHTITQEEFEYIKNDIEIIAIALEQQFEQGLKKMTNGSDALAGFKDIIGKKVFEKHFPVFNHKLNEQVRWAYRGGFTWLNDKYAGKDIETGIVFDVNSLYPAQMYYRPLPYGAPLPFKGEYKQDDLYPLFIQHIRCEFELKDGKIPTIQIKRNMLFKANEYLKDSKGEVVDLFVSNIDLELMKEHYHLYDVEYLGGYKFRQKTGLFNDYIDYWTEIKINNDGAIKLLAKLMLNSLYGKFATNPNVTGKVPFLREDGSCGFAMGEDELKDPIYTPMGVFITSWARYTTITTAQKCYDRIIYCDTDSIHLTGGDIPEAIKDEVHPKELGKWAYEGTFKRARYLRQKTYIQELYGKTYTNDEGKEIFTECSPLDATTTKVSVKCAGMPDNIKKNVNFDNFFVGLTLPGKLMPQHVDGGIVLVDTTFSVK